MDENIIAKIKEIVNNSNSISTKKLPNSFLKYNDNDSHSFNVYKIPISLLSYNPNNGRITSFMSKIESSKEQDDINLNEKIETFIIESNKNENNKTKNNIKLNGQQEPGIILDNGIVIDGNRRFTCLRQLSREGHDKEFEYFEAVVLSSSEISEKEIKMLELAIQVGKDEKIDYEPMERALDMYNRIEIKKILNSREYSEASNIKEKDILKNIEIIKLIVEYLEYIGKEKDFSIIKNEKKWEHFVEMYNKSSKLKEQEPDTYEQLKNIGFDYVFVSPYSDDSKEIRKLFNALTNKKNNKDRDEFIKKHTLYNNEIKEIIENNESYEKKKEEIKNNENLIIGLHNEKITLLNKDTLNKNLHETLDLQNPVNNLYDLIKNKFKESDLDFLENNSSILNLLNSFENLKKILEEKITIMREKIKSYDEK